MADNSPPTSDEGTPLIDRLGTFYLCFAVLWTAVLALAVINLSRKHNSPRYLVGYSPAALSAVFMLHTYWMTFMVEYPLRTIFSCWFEFWMMGVALPFGVALFQASNIQVLHKALAHRGFVGRDNTMISPPGQTPIVLRVSAGRWIAVGMIVQLCVTFIYFMATGRIHDERYGPWLQDSDKLDCRRGFEWFPSIVWQVFWTWVHAPYKLYETWSIRGLHYWRLQTALCIVAGSFGFPMWYATVYSSSQDFFTQINKYWAPPLWFVPGAMMMEFVTLFFPHYGNKTREQNDFGQHRATMSDNTGDNGGIYSIASFEEAMSTNSSPLLHFAVNKDFSGENIMFLTHIRNWKAAWGRLNGKQGEELSYQRRHLFNVGVEIHATFVNIETAQLAINIESGVQEGLAAIFGEAAKLIDLPGSANVITPFAQPATPVIGGQSISTTSLSRPSTANTSEGATLPASLSEASTSYTHNDILLRCLGDIVTIDPRVPPDVEIPDGFDASVFDQAEHSIKMLVLRDTWPKYVEATQNAMQDATQESSEEPAPAQPATKKKKNNKMSRLFPSKK